MTIFVALLRAINVGGTGKLPLTALRALCEEAGLSNVATYIQSGNVVFQSRSKEAAVKRTLEKALAEHMGKPFGVLVRTAADLESVLERNPFKKAEAKRTLVLFLDEAPPKNALKDLVIPGREEVRLDGREVFVHYPDGMGASKLKLPLAKEGTGRNMNTVEKLAAMARDAAE